MMKSRGIASLKINKLGLKGGGCLCPTVNRAGDLRIKYLMKERVSSDILGGGTASRYPPLPGKPGPGCLLGEGASVSCLR